jgi:hypothetical protein
MNKKQRTVVSLIPIALKTTSSYVRKLTTLLVISFMWVMMLFGKLLQKTQPSVSETGGNKGTNDKEEEEKICAQ